MTTPDIALFTAAEQALLRAVADALIPSLVGDPVSFYARRAADLNVAEWMMRAFIAVGSPDDQTRFKQALTALENPALNFVAAGQARPFSALDPAARERVLQGWANSPLEQLRAGFQTLKRLCMFIYYAVPAPDGTNPNWPELGYPGLQTPPPAPRMIQPLAITTDTLLDADVVIVGSGAGGGVVAGQLAAAGYNVVVLEKGGYYHETDFDGGEFSAFQRTFEKQGLLVTQDAGMSILAGTGLGGGTLINWAASMPTPPEVLEEWAREHGVTAATGPEWQAGLEAVQARLSVSTDTSAHNQPNQKLVSGCETLGYHWRTVPRNARNCQDCGYCCHGCRFGAKQSTLKTYLQDAWERGATIVVNCHVEKVLVRHGEAAGVTARVGPHRVTVQARQVVVAAGSLHTPALLLRSGLHHLHIGRNLHMHPTAAVFGLYDHLIEMWHGAPLTAACLQFRDLDHGYGTLIEVPAAHPGLVGLGLPWRTARGHKDLMRQIAYMAPFIAITRDRHGGVVRVNAQGDPIIEYTLAPFDARHVLRGAQEAVRIHAAAGARVIGGPYNDFEPFTTSTKSNLAAYVRRFVLRGYVKNDLQIFSAHQMSSCRMGGDRVRAPLSPEGESYEVKRLFVADASALPSATGVNPMLSIMGLAYHVSRALAARLG